MKYIKTYKIFESDINHIEDEVGDILLELEDRGFQVSIDRIRQDVEDDTLQRKVKRTDVYLEVYIRRPFGSKDRVIPGAPEPPSGKYPGPVFLWFEVKEAVVRLNNWYYDYSGQEGTPGISGKTVSDLEKLGIKYKTNSPFRMFNGGVEFGIGWHKPEDFDHLGDFISFTSLKILVRI